MDILFFSPTNPFTGLDDDWEIQNNNATDSQQTATALKKDGDFLRAAQYDNKQTVNLSFIGKKTSGNYTLAALACGVVSQGWHIDTLAVKYSQTSQPTLDITGHKHLTGTGHAANGCRTYEPSVTFPALDIGCPTTMSAFTLSQDCQAAIRSIAYQMQVNHVDELNNVGQHLAGDNYDGTETITIEFTGEFGTNDFTAAEGWLVETKAHPRTNTGVNQTTVTLTHHVAHTTDTGSDSSSNT